MLMLKMTLAELHVQVGQQNVKVEMKQVIRMMKTLNKNPPQNGV